MTVGIELVIRIRIIFPHFMINQHIIVPLSLLSVYKYCKIVKELSSLNQGLLKYATSKFCNQSLPFFSESESTRFNTKYGIKKC